jgi:thiol-disulfide isomerase/thioredoxin
MSQTGEEWSLYSHYGKIVVLDFSAMWCGYCQKAAQVAQQIQDEHDDVVWVTILLQNNYGQQPSLDDLKEWATAFELSSSPILSGHEGIIDVTGQDGYNVRSWPGLVVIDKDMTIAYELHGWNEAQVKIWLDILTAPEELP